MIVILTSFLLVHADNVGDNVGDIAGMGADLFGSFAEATCAALVISSVSTIGEYHSYVGMSFPLLISAAGILVCLATTFIATDLRPARMVSEIENTLKYQLIISTVISTPVRSLSSHLFCYALLPQILCTPEASATRACFSLGCALAEPPAMSWRLWHSARS